MTRHWLSPVPGRDLTQPLDSTIVDARQDVSKPSLWIGVVEPGGGDEGVTKEIADQIFKTGALN
jgi:hypothetical protein